MWSSLPTSCRRHNITGTTFLSQLWQDLLWWLNHLHLRWHVLTIIRIDSSVQTVFACECSSCKLALSRLVLACVALWALRHFDHTVLRAARRRMRIRKSSPVKTGPFIDWAGAHANGASLRFLFNWLKSLVLDRVCWRSVLTQKHVGHVCVFTSCLGHSRLIAISQKATLHHIILIKWRDWGSNFIFLQLHLIVSISNNVRCLENLDPRG